MSQPKLSFGPRGEDIHYSRQGLSAWLGFTWCDGPRIYPDSLKTWEDSTEAIPTQEKDAILRLALAFVNQDGGRPTVVINRDDPDSSLWLDICNGEASAIEGIEYTSNQEQRQAQKKVYLEVLKAGKGLTINGKEIRNEADLDAVIDFDGTFRPSSG